MLSKRLLKIASLIDTKEIIDIGCDHAYLDIYLVQNNIVPLTLACDINEKALNNGIKNIKKYDRENEKYIQEKNKIISEVKDFLDKYNTELIILFNQADFICEYNDDEVAMVLRRTLESINNNLAFIEEKEQGTIVKDTVSKIRKRTR